MKPASEIGMGALPIFCAGYVLETMQKGPKCLTLEGGLRAWPRAKLCSQHVKTTRRLQLGERFLQPASTSGPVRKFER